ncbi:hypothetical protein [Pseudomonas oryzihabitans]|uniref:Uncharacterized protein n=1 Tax=Pseudomonas oryzihabitans TaxID=47885 RepID=A0A1G5MVR3_9PSED|nr:hypothetical protein [Pseudomonas psychrotolerans]NMY89845.1 hypothetical protein [Pseudomonas psychrotolerans]SCZ28934.1 hypothetical protein SAMN05216279_103146 [Pseudomonas psychrotolerans]
MSEISQLPVDEDVAKRLAQLVAMNINAVMGEAIRDPLIRASIVATLGARPPEALSTDERIWLEWCKTFG